MTQINAIDGSKLDGYCLQHGDVQHLLRNNGCGGMLHAIEFDEQGRESLR